MSEREEETTYRVTDRRKYNPDGSPREGAEPHPPVPEEIQVEAPIPPREQASGNVLSFPGETASKQPQTSAASPQAAPVVSEPRPAAPASGPSAGQVEQAYNSVRGPQSARLPEASFLSLANMLAVEAAMHLGLIQTPGEEAPPVDLEAGRHLIDMLGMLQNRTHGNLSQEEEDLLEKILADLRMQFVAISKRR